MFSERFDFKFPCLVNFVGGGGKTGLILKLAEEFSEHLTVAYTTTTRIHPPAQREGMALISCDDSVLLKKLVESSAKKCPGLIRTYVVTQPFISEDLLLGVGADFGPLLDRSLFPLVLNEADGARSMSLKMPREDEPVLMRGAHYLVPVIGVDCLHRPLGPDTLFRWEMARKRFSLSEGEVVTADMAASLLLHPSGVCKDWQPGVEIIPFINKVDEEELDERAIQLAKALLGNGRLPIQRVIWGSLHRGRAGVVCPQEA